MQSTIGFRLGNSSAIHLACSVQSLVSSLAGRDIVGVETLGLDLSKMIPNPALVQVTQRKLPDPSNFLCYCRHDP